MVLGARFRGDGVGNLMESARVPHRRHPDRLRKRSGQTGAGYAVQALVPIIVCGHPETGNRGRVIQHLSELLPQRHPPDEIINALIERLRRVLVTGSSLNVRDLLRPGRLGRLELRGRDFGDHPTGAGPDPDGVEHGVAFPPLKPNGHRPAERIVHHLQRSLKAIGPVKTAGSLEDVECFDQRCRAAGDIDETLAFAVLYCFRQVDLQRIVSRREADHRGFEGGTKRQR